jgi:hypothetical protein
VGRWPIGRDGGHSREIQLGDDFTKRYDNCSVSVNKIYYTLYFISQSMGVLANFFGAKLLKFWDWGKSLEPNF